MTVRVKHPRMVVRFGVRLRREGGSLSLTVPRFIARKWRLEPGHRLIVRSTDEGILLYPRWYMRVIRGPEVPD